MSARRRRASRRQAGAGLFLVYALASLLPVLGLGAVLVHNAHEAGRSRALAQGRSQAAVIVQMAIAPALDGRDLDRGLTGAEVTRLQRATDLAVYSGSLSALRLRSFGGAVVFSDNGTRTSTVSTTSQAFRDAARGRTDVALTVAPGGRTRAIRVLLPVVPNVTGQATGVLEVYLPAGPIAAAVRSETHRTYLLLAAGLAVLYLVLAVIAWSTTRRLRRFAARQSHEANHDSLTGLPNRAAFRAAAEHALTDPRGGALVLVDLDKFKQVNDELGHHAGDTLLRCVADRLTSTVRTDDVVARLGGDEFGVLLPGATDPTAVLVLLDQVHVALAEAVPVEGESLSVRASMGVALFPEHGAELDQLLVRADAAMYRGKRGPLRTVIHEPGAVPAAGVLAP